ncbi:hypothetical protein MPSEU_000417800 [Mayamaea pseudoterrestris]|nr:hypothetical protein MPSEU_000417800 [Mayamaea pseudoterrestris]
MFSLLTRSGKQSGVCINYRHFSQAIAQKKSISREPAAALPTPQVLYTNNHLLVVNKPPGWHSMPGTDRKSIVSYLQSQRLGGGSQNTYLTPLHRIDQPCSGVLMLAKTKRIAQRIQSNWNKAVVRKIYFCVLDDSVNLERLEQASSKCVNDEWMELTGYHLPTRQQHQGQMIHGTAPKGWSVTMALHVNDANQADCMRTIQWRRAVVEDSNDTSRNNTLLAIETHQGSRHMIRALLGMVQCPIAGDVRYGARRPLPDWSVALHAKRLDLSPDLSLGQGDAQRTFEANIPRTWSSYFGMREQNVEKGFGTL